MHNLDRLRKERGLLNEKEISLPQAISIQESLRQWVELQTAFEWQLQQTAELFGRDRWVALTELQARLRRLNN